MTNWFIKYRYRIHKLDKWIHKNQVLTACHPLEWLTGMNAAHSNGELVLEFYTEISDELTTTWIEKKG
jgi:hypothetical protein